MIGREHVSIEEREPRENDLEECKDFIIDLSKLALMGFTAKKLVEVF